MESSRSPKIDRKKKISNSEVTHQISNKDGVHQLGIDRIKGIKDLRINEFKKSSLASLITKYEKLWVQLEAAQNSKTKISKIIKILRTLVEIDREGSLQGEDFSLDILIELKKFYCWCNDSRKLTEQDKKFLNDIPTKEKDAREFKLVRNMIEQKYTPLLIRNTANGLYASSEPGVYNIDDIVSVNNMLQKEKDASESKSADEKRLELKVSRLLDQLNQLRYFYHEQFTNLHNTWFQTALTLLKSPEVKPRVVRRNIQSQKKQDDLVMSKLDMSEEVLAPTIESKDELPHDRKPFKTKSIRNVYLVSESALQMAFQLLKDPDFDAFEKKVQANCHIKLKEILLNIIIAHVNQLDALLTQSQSLQMKLKTDQALHKVATDLSKIINGPELSAKYFAEGQVIHESELLNKQLHGKNYQITHLTSGNAPLFIIKDVTENISVILRVRPIAQAEVAPDTVRLHATASLNLSVITQQFALIPGKFDDGFGNEYRDYEITEFVQGQNMRTLYKNLHEKIAANSEKQQEHIVELQSKFLDHALKMIDFVIRLRENGICFTDLKPGNFLVTEDGSLRVSDCKSFINIEDVLDNSQYNSFLFLQLTPSYCTSRVKLTPAQGYKFCYDVDRLAKETLAFSLLQMYTNSDLSDKEKSFDLTNAKDNILFTGDLGEKILGIFTCMGECLQNGGDYFAKLIELFNDPLISDAITVSRKKNKAKTEVDRKPENEEAKTEQPEAPGLRH